MPTLPGGYTAGDVLAAADLNALPGGYIGHSTKTSNQTVTAPGTTSITGMEVTFTAVAGRYYKLSATISVSGASDNAQWVVDFAEGTSNIGLLGRFESTDGGNDGTTTFGGSIIHEPGAGSVTYRLRAAREAGAGDLVFEGNVLRPAFFIVEDIGPS
jgi:hypothetical protein